MEKGKDILSEYGNDIPHKEASVAKSGGCTEAKPLKYSEPVGPKNMTHGPGIGGTNHGCGPQGKH